MKKGRKKGIIILNTLAKRKIRSGIDIITDILKVAKNGTKKSRIIYSAKLFNKEQIKKYFKLLINKNFLEYDPIKKEYKTTNKGLELLKEYYEFKEAEDNYAKKLKSLREVVKNL